MRTLVGAVRTGSTPHINLNVLYKAKEKDRKWNDGMTLAVEIGKAVASSLRVVVLQKLPHKQAQ